VPADLAGSWTRIGARLLDYPFVHMGLLALSAALDLSLGFPDGGGYALTVLAVLVVYETSFSTAGARRSPSSCSASRSSGPTGHR
jgi:hypothetical protein